MDNTISISNAEFFSAIISSKILEKYSQQDSGLVELLKNANHPDIHYSQSYAIAKQIKRIFKRRMDYMTLKGIESNLEATKQLVAFLEEYPNSHIYNVTFNCQSQHYGVRCGLIDNQLHVICVMTGGHIPDELFEKETK